MCMQCAATAAVTVGSATGIRAWVGVHQPRWLDERRMTVLTVCLLVLAVLAAGTIRGA